MSWIAKCIIVCEPHLFEQIIRSRPSKLVHEAATPVKLKHAVTHILHEVPVCVCVCLNMCVYLCVYVCVFVHVEQV